MANDEYQLTKAEQCNNMFSLITLSRLPNNSECQTEAGLPFNTLDNFEPESTMTFEYIKIL